MTSTAANFFTLMVEPTATEFIKSPFDMRRGLLAAIVLNHMVDHIALEGKSSTDRNTMDTWVSDVRKDMLKICPEFQFIQDIADATKHAKLSTSKKTNKPIREVSSSDQVSASPGMFEAPFGQGVFREAVVVYATLKDGSSRPLLPAVESVLNAWKTHFTQTMTQHSSGTVDLPQNR